MLEALTYVVYGPSPSNVCAASTAFATPVFTDGPDYLFVNASNIDEVYAHGDIYAGGGDDVIDLNAYPGLPIPMYVYGQGGNDILTGAYHRAYLYGGIGDDRFFGGDHETFFVGGPGNDVSSGGYQNIAVYENLSSMRGYTDA